MTLFLPGSTIMMKKAWLLLSGLASLSMLAACSITGNLGGLQAAHDGGAKEGGGGSAQDGAAGGGGSAGTDAGGSAGCDGGAEAGCKPAEPCSPDDSPCTDDGNLCTTDICKGGLCQHTLLAEGVGCGNGKVCSATGKCSDACGIGGQLYAAGATNPTNACEKCDPTNSPSAWTAAADGAPCADDGNSCTKDECAAGVCTHPDLAVGDSCGGGKVCDTSLTCNPGCVIGGQFYKDAEVDPSNSCQSCDAAKSTSAWSPLADSSACTDDGNPCTQDECQSGACTHPAQPNTTSCGSGGHCKSGQCTASCLIGNVSYPEGTLNPANPCESCQSAKNAAGWSPLGDGTSCGSSSCDKYGSCGSFSSSCDTSGIKSRTCTDHVCKAGTCTAPTHTETAGCTRTTDGNSCTDDGSSCTSDLCSGGACTHPKLAGGTSCGSAKICDGNAGCVTGCWISGTLYSSGATKPGNTCQSCQPASSTSAWTNVTSGTSETICASTTCGKYGSCGGFVSVCDENGTHSRSCTDYTCNAGVCAGKDRTDTGNCTRNTDGATCASDNNSCTLDECHAGVCAHPNAPDGTKCGAAIGCNNRTCKAGTCFDTTSCPSGDSCCPDGTCVSSAGICKL